MFSQLACTLLEVKSLSPHLVGADSRWAIWSGLLFPWPKSHSTNPVTVPRCRNRSVPEILNRGGDTHTPLQSSLIADPRCTQKNWKRQHHSWWWMDGLPHPLRCCFSFGIMARWWACISPWEQRSPLGSKSREKSFFCKHASAAFKILY